jgi:hypothetical protein
MKNTIFLFVAALLFGAAVNAQTTVDSIRSKYQLQPMPDALTIEKTFPVLGSYQLTAKDGSIQNVVVTLDSVNRGIIWVDGLPEGRFKAYLKKSPGLYRVVTQKAVSGKQVPEGTLMFDPATNTLNVALGKKYDDVDPVAVFALNPNATATTDVTASTDVAAPTEVKVKTKKGDSKTKSKLFFYTATKAEVATSTSTDAAKQ